MFASLVPMSVHFDPLFQDELSPRRPKEVNMKRIERRPIIDISDLNTVQQPSNKHENEKTQSQKKRDQRQNRVTI
jgi:hypothetical protein